MTYKCPECGEDVTAEVLRKRRTTGVEYRSRFAPGEEPRPEPVVVTCSKGHTYRY